MYPKLMLTALLTDLLLMLLALAGTYYGFTLPVAWQAPQPTGAAIETGLQIRATLPLWMPSIQQLGLPMPMLASPEQPKLWLTLLAGFVCVCVLAYSRSVYLGGLRAVVLRERPQSLLAYGRRYFRPMFGFTLLHMGFAAAAILADAHSNEAVGLLFLLVSLPFVLTPYMVVLRDLSLGRALTAAAGALFSHFRSFVPFALFSMLTVSLIGALGMMEKPFHVYALLLAYSIVGTLLIASFMDRLNERLNQNSDKRAARNIGKQVTVAVPFSRSAVVAAIFLLLIAPIVGVLIYTGYPLQAVRLFASNGDRLDGVIHRIPFSSVRNASNQTYDAYDWQMQHEYSIRLGLPDLASGAAPSELRGLAHVRGLVAKEYVTRSDRGSVYSVEWTPEELTIAYRLVREQSADGSAYYTSRGGLAALLGPTNDFREPLSFTMTASGDGRHVFLMQYPTRFAASIDQLYRVSEDGRFLIPRGSQINTDDFLTYWFVQNPRQEEVFELLQAKNKNAVSQGRQWETQIATAMLEADGNRIVQLLHLLSQTGTSLHVPDWNEQHWTNALRALYAPADWADTLAYLSNSAAHSHFYARPHPLNGPEAPPSSDREEVRQVSQEHPDQDSEESSSLWLPFPAQWVELIYATDAHGKLSMLDIRDWTEQR